MIAITRCGNGHIHRVPSAAPARLSEKNVHAAFSSKADFCQTCEEPVHCSFELEPSRGEPYPEMKSEKEGRERRCYGRTEAELREMVEQLFRDGQPRIITAISMLSNAQEEIDLARTEDARQTINMAKFIIAEYLATRDEQGRMVDPDAV